MHSKRSSTNIVFIFCISSESPQPSLVIGLGASKLKTSRRCTGKVSVNSAVLSDAKSRGAWSSLNEDEFIKIGLS